MTLRTRVTTGAAALFAAVLACASIVLVNLVDRQLRQDLSAQNAQTLRDIADELERGVAVTGLVLPLGTDGTEFLIGDERGNTLRSTVSALDPGDDPPIQLEPSSTLPVDEVVMVGPPVEFDIDLFDRTMLEATAPDGVHYELLALSPNIIVERSVGQVRNALLFVIPVLAVVLGAAIWFMTGRVLRPVSQMIDRVDKIGGATLDRRLDVPGTNDEIDRLAVTLNTMLERLEASSQQQRQFVSDASHELRTPLSAMIGEAELAGASGDPVRMRHANDRIVAGGNRLAELIDDLLSLARSGQSALRPIEIDVDDIVRSEASRQDRPIDTSNVAPVKVAADPAAISRVVRNLLDNAVRYAVHPVVVHTSSFSDRERGPGARIVIDDDGPGIAPEYRERVFERFARVDVSRDRASGGTGLGLAISRSLVTAHDGTIRIETSPLGGARVIVDLPA